MFIGLGLMAYPYFIADPAILCGVGLSGSFLLFLLCR